jgi:hypothetical protein
MRASKLYFRTMQNHLFFSLKFEPIFSVFLKVGIFQKLYKKFCNSTGNINTNLGSMTQSPKLNMQFH